MANVLYDEARSQMMVGGFDWTNDAFAFSLFDDLYTPVAAHSWADVSTRIVATTATFPTCSVNGAGGAAIDTNAFIAGVTTATGRRVAGVLLHRTSDNLLVCAITNGLSGFAGVPYVPREADDMTFYIVPDAGVGNAVFRL